MPLGFCISFLHPSLNLTNYIHVRILASSQKVMSPTKEIGFIMEPSAVFENEYSLGAFIANEEFETSFNNFRKL